MKFWTERDSWVPDFGPGIRFIQKRDIDKEEMPSHNRTLASGIFIKNEYNV